VTIAVRVRALVRALVMLSLCLAPGTAAPRAAQAQGSGNISYVYDQLGRLLAVSDPSQTNGTAVYSYDAVGNLTGITRQSATTLAILEFTPHSGAAGSAVTIYGTGFSTTPGANAVKFNGTTATVTAATATQLTVTVPTGASTGTISVTVSGTMVTSTATFTVVSTIPTINAIVPQNGGTVSGVGGTPYPVAAQGSTVNVFGTNLETSFPQSSPTVAALNVAADNVVAVNGQRAAVRALTPPPNPTPTATLVAGTGVISAALPTNVTSGRLTVRVPGGVSTGDSFLFVPPASKAPSDVTFADWMTVAPTSRNPLSFTIGTAGKLALIAFDGTQGQRINLQATSWAIGSGLSCHADVAVHNPDGTVLADQSCVLGTGLILDTTTLPVAGTYTIVVTPNGSDTGSATLELQDVGSDATPTLMIGGSATVNLTTPGQNAVVGFTGPAGAHLNLTLSNDTIGSGTGIGCKSAVTVRDRSGNTLTADGNVPAATSCPEVGGTIPPFTLPYSGPYTILVDPTGTFTGSITLSLAVSATPTATNTPTGPSPTLTNTPVPTATNTPNGSATPTFTPTRAPTATPITGPVLRARPTYVAPGGVSSVDWGGIFPPLTPTSNDWIGLYPSSTQGDASPVATVFTTGGVTGQVAVPIPTSAPTSQTYETRLFNIAGAATRVAVSNSFAVVLTTPTPPATGGPSPTATSTATPGASPTPTSTPTSGPSPTPSASLSVRPAIIPQGGSVSANWTGIPAPTASDWIGLYVPGAPDSPTPTATVLTTRQSSGQVAFPLSATLAPGTYELRLFNGTGTTNRLAVSNSFAVTAPVSSQHLDTPLPEEGVAPRPQLPTPAGGDSLRLLSSWRPLLPPVLSEPDGLAPIASPAPPSVDDDPTWQPETSWTPFLLRRTQTASPWRALPAYQADAGETALAGQVLGMDGEPLAGVTLRLAETSAVTDESGRFLLRGLPDGHQVLTIDGATAAYPGRTYGVFEAGVDLAPDETTVLPFTIWLPRIDTGNTITIPSPTTEEVVLTSPRIPGLEVHLAPGTVIRDRDGNPLTDFSLTVIPQDRPPFPLPDGVYTPVYFTVQPAGATIGPYGARIIYPNYTHAPPGTRASFWHYDPQDQGWYIYGRGTVTADGQQIVPDPSAAVYELTAAMTHPDSGGPEPPDGGGPSPDDGDGGGDPPDGDGDGGDPSDPGQPTGGEPVDLSTGLFVVRARDLTLGDVIPLRLTRTYRPLDVNSTGSPNIRAFGIGASHPYEMYLYSPVANSGNSADLILPDGGRVHYTILSGCTPGPGVDCLTNTVYQHTATPTRWYGSTIAWWQTATSNGWNLTLRDGTVYVFGNGSGLQAVRDRHGNQVAITRDSQNRVLRITSPNGRWLAFTYGDSTFTKSVTQVTDNIGRTVSYTYCHATDPCLAGGGSPGTTWAGLLWKVVDAKGGLTQYTYDPTTHGLYSIMDPNGSAASPQYTIVSTTYDANGRVYQQTEVDGSLWTFQYTLSGGKVTQTLVTDPRGIQRQVSFNSSGYMTQDIAAYGQCEQRTTSYSRDPTTNLVASVTTAAPVTTCSDTPGRQTSYTHDEWGRLTSVTRLAGTADAVTTTLSYEPTFHQLSSVTDPLGHTARFTYDAQGNLVVATDPMGQDTVLTYNPAGQPLTVTDPLDHTTQYRYALGDLVAVTDPLGNQIQRFVDNAGRRVSVTNALGQLGRREFDPLDKVVKQTDPLGQTTQFGYDANSFLTAVTDALSHATSYTRDKTNRVTQRTDARSQSDQYLYDLMGNLTQVTDRRGKITTYCYDNLNRRTFAGFGTISTPGACAAGSNYESTISYTWDKGGRLQQAADSANGTITRVYDDLDRLTSETTPQTAPNTSVSYGYDAASRRTSLTVNGQANSVSYGYDNDSRLTQVAQGSTQVGLSYDPAGRRTLLTLPNGAAVTYSYDTASQLTGITYQVGGSTTGTLSYGYDAAHQRTSVTGTYARTGLPSAITTAAYDNDNRITNWNGTTWPSTNWDNDGNLLTDGTNSYTWNARNQLTAISGGTTASFSYDAFGRRQSKTTSGTATSFLYDGLNAVQERVGGAVTANLLTGGLDEVFARTEGTTTRALLADALGSTVALVEPGGSLLTQYQYEPFGQTTVLGPASGNPSQYTGRENDGTGLYYYRARYYSPTYQRFISEDPLGFGGGINPYAYTANAPTSFRDPLGLTKETRKDLLPEDHEAPEYDFDCAGHDATRMQQDPGDCAGGMSSGPRATSASDDPYTEPANTRGHSREHPLTPQQAQQAAAMAQNPDMPGVRSFTGADGRVRSIDPNTGLFVVAENGRVVTAYVHPGNRAQHLQYFQRQMEQNGVQFPDR